MKVAALLAASANAVNPFQFFHPSLWWNEARNVFNSTTENWENLTSTVDTVSKPKLSDNFRLLCNFRKFDLWWPLLTAKVIYKISRLWLLKWNLISFRLLVISVSGLIFSLVSNYRKYIFLTCKFSSNCLGTNHILSSNVEFL